MLPACNTGTSQAMGCPDPCLTPAAPSPIVVPYPNMSMHAQTTNPVPTVNVSGLPALNMASKTAMTSGMEAGSAHAMYKGPGGITMGVPNINVAGMPGVALANQTNGNNYNNPMGVVNVPPAANVVYNCAVADGATARPTTATSIGGLLGALNTAGHLTARMDAAGTLHVRPVLIDADMLRRLDTAITDYPSALALALDLRGCRGGDVGAALRLLGRLIGPGRTAGWHRHPDGDEQPLRSRGSQRYCLPMTVWIDGGTASAAELLAGALQHHGRARLHGSPSYGKGALHQPLASGLLASPADAPALVGELLTPDRTPIAGTGIIPDVAD